MHEAGSLRVRCPGAPAAELEAVLINTAGGVAGGDRFSLDIAAGEGTRLVVTTAAAEKVYRTLGPDSTIDVKLDVAGRRDARLAAAGDDPVRPRAAVALDRGVARRRTRALFLAEAIVFGRSGMGEAVEEGALIDRWRVRRGGKLIYAETVRLDGAIAARLAEPAVAKGGVAIATVLIVPGDEATVAAVRALASSSPARSARRPGTALRRCACARPTAPRYGATSSML